MRELWNYLNERFEEVERPLKAIEKLSGDFINRGVSVPSIDADKLWEVTVLVKAGDTLHPGDVYATCPETPIITHKCMVPPQLYGTVKAVKPSGAYKVNDTVVTITDEDGLIGTGMKVEQSADLDHDQAMAVIAEHTKFGRGSSHIE